MRESELGSIFPICVVSILSYRGCAGDIVGVKMSSDGAGAIAFKGLGLMMNASKQGMAALSGGLDKVRKQYASKHQADVIAELKKKNVPPSELMFQCDFLAP